VIASWVSVLSCSESSRYINTRSRLFPILRRRRSRVICLAISGSISHMALLTHLNRYISWLDTLRRHTVKACTEYKVQDLRRGGVWLWYVRKLVGCTSCIVDQTKWLLLSNDQITMCVGPNSIWTCMTTICISLAVLFQDEPCSYS
jgi:hypothetical protein